MRPLAAHGIDPAVLHTPLWQPGRMVQEVRRALGEGTELFILNHVSNVFGAVCPLDEIGRLLSAADVPLILDASQSAGVLELDVSRCPCLAAVCMPGHKALYGPMGTGLLLALDDRLASRPLMAGGTGSLSGKHEPAGFSAGRAGERHAQRPRHRRACRRYPLRALGRRGEHRRT